MVLLFAFQFNSFGQERYGNTVNLGVGIGGHYGYYRFAGRSIPVLHLDYEFDVARNFTLAPFVNVHTFNRKRYWGNSNHPHRDYNYHQTAFALGVKGTYYFDALLNAGSNWDFYLAGSVGFVAVHSRWESDYDGDRDYYARPNPLFLDVHIGVEYHITNRVGIFLDVSSGVSTLGLAFHRR